MTDRLRLEYRRGQGSVRIHLMRGERCVAVTTAPPGQHREKGAELKRAYLHQPTPPAEDSASE